MYKCFVCQRELVICFVGVIRSCETKRHTKRMSEPLKREAELMNHLTTGRNETVNTNQMIGENTILLMDFVSNDLRYSDNGSPAFNHAHMFVICASTQIYANLPHDLEHYLSSSYS